MNITESGPPDRIFGEQVTANYFSTLGSFAGPGPRLSCRRRIGPGANHVVIVTDELWRSRFGADSHFLGSTITLDNEKYTVVGIMPPGFRSPSQFNMTIPLLFLCSRGLSGGLAGASRRPWHQRTGPTEAGRDSIGGARGARRDFAEPGATVSGACKNVKTGTDAVAVDISGGVRTSLFILLGAVGLILLIACANLANLLLVRAIGRQREIAIRFALGASRYRVIGELLAQSTVLAGVRLRRGAGVRILDAEECSPDSRPICRGSMELR